MTSTQNPVGACGDAAPTGDTLNAVAYARGVLQVEADTYRRQRDQALAALDYLLAALDGGHQWEIDHAIHRGTLTATYLKDRP